MATHRSQLLWGHEMRQSQPQVSKSVLERCHQNAWIADNGPGSAAENLLINAGYERWEKQAGIENVRKGQ